MSVHVSFDTAVKACVPTFNAGINQLTKKFYSRLNPILPTEDKMVHAANFHYNVKATLYNLVTVIGAIAAAIFFGFSSPIASVGIMGATLFTRAIIDRSMSTTDSAKDTATQFLETAKSKLKAIWNKTTGNSTTSEILGSSVWDQGFTMTLLLASKLYSKANDLGWSEDMIKIGRYTLFKNWHVTISMMLK